MSSKNQTNEQTKTDDAKPIGIQEDELKICVKKFFNIKDGDNFVIYKCDSRPASDELIGYLGEYQKVTVLVKLNGVDKVMNIFIKSIPEDAKRAQEIMELKFFCREINAYNEIFSQFINRSDEDTFLSRYLLATNKSLFFEDISVKGFCMTNPRESLDDTHFFVALEQIGKFHAESLILEERKSIENKHPYRLGEEFKHILNDYGYHYDGWYCLGVDAGLEAAKLSENMPTNVDTAVFAKTWHQLFKNALQLCRASETTRNVLCHRDLWSNNLMFRYDEDRTPIQCIIVDFQAVGCMTPAGDVMSFIYLNIIDERRHDNLETYLQHYYRTMERQLKQSGFNIETLITWNEFRTSCDTYKTLALVQSVILQQLGLIEGKQASSIFKDSERFSNLMSVSRSDLIVNLINTDPIYKKLFMFNIDELIKMCI